ncbi:MAG TPA: acylphosphatase [Candidatus Nanopelagicaceae bacterium]|nr:acylphosphatase [Candidatus Nanopelagicaceae bacterium]
MTELHSGAVSGLLCRRARIVGRVQMVGFRAFAVAEGRRRGLAGWVRNCDDGSVELLAQGPEAAVGEFLQVMGRGPAAARVDHMEVEDAATSDRMAPFRADG